MIHLLILIKHSKRKTIKITTSTLINLEMSEEKILTPILK